tara:strand:- start:458 stop:1243 length:786 start_codon:yes stop_codon:yes gene_type:complete
MRYLSVVAVMKDERKNLKEWIDFHLKVGVEHFYLYDNGSSDGSTEVLSPYIESGQVTYSYNTMDMCQMSCYFNAVTAFRDQSRWMAFIDLDEFLYSPKGDLKEQLKGFEQFPGIAVNEVFYGSNGHETRPADGVLLNYTKRRKEVDKHIKSICQPALTLCSAFNPHSFIYTQGMAVNENKQQCPGPFNDEATADIFRINHYWVKSREEYETKLTRGRADVPSRDPQFRYTSGIGRKLDEVFLQDNEVEDTEIWKFLERKHG